MNTQARFKEKRFMLKFPASLLKQLKTHCKQNKNRRRIRAILWLSALELPHMDIVCKNKRWQGIFSKDSNVHVSVGLIIPPGEGDKAFGLSVRHTVGWLSCVRFSQNDKAKDFISLSLAELLLIYCSCAPRMSENPFLVKFGFKT